MSENNDVLIFAFRYVLEDLNMFYHIKGFDSYVINQKGQVKSYLTNKILKQQPLKKSGYLRVFLRKNGETTTCYAHRLVAETFIANPESKKEVNHIDGNKQNNNIDNLEWTTKKENAEHAQKYMLTDRGKSRNGGVVAGIKIDKKHKNKPFRADGTGANGKRMFLGNYKTIEEATFVLNNFYKKQKKEVFILKQAFKYALGRMTYATSIVSDEIVQRWDIMDKVTQKRIQREIREAIDNDRAGMDMDIREWKKVLELKV